MRRSTPGGARSRWSSSTPRRWLRPFSGLVGLGQRLSEEELHAPHLLDSEVTNALRGLVLGNRLDVQSAERALDGLQSAGVTRYPASPLTRRVWQLRANLTAYDALYVALAERLGCALVTADARIARAPGLRCAVEVVD